jgi:dihydrofolate reductase
MFMRKVVFAINISTDGYCSHTEVVGGVGVLEYYTTLLRSANLMLFGRNTYQIMVPYWPNIAKTQSETKAENEFARVFDSLDKIVFSSTLPHVGGKNTRIVRTNLEEEVLTLKQRSGKDIYVGGGNLSIASQLSTRGLIDEYHFVVQPLVVGKGPRLFETVKPENRLRMDFIGSETFESGVVALHYRKHT